jgi:serine/threonine protein kinase
MIALTLKLTAKMHRAESADGERVILKLTDEHEVEVLRRLHGNQSTKQTRMIPLLDVVGGRLIVLPLRTPLPLFLDLDASVGDIGELALQFLEGVAHLQRSSVAHLDLKPDNIVVQRDPKSKKVDLAIIDLNIAVFADAEPTISTSSGTDGWSAPEVSAGKPYDPLLADRWSCSRVLKDFTELMEPSRLRERMCILSQQLMDPSPSRRPPIPDRLNLCSQGVEGAPSASFRSRRGGGRKPSREQPRRSMRLKGLRPQDQRLR